ncbi:MAG TPA: hypothetical protein VFB79_18645 [Candidatus Angelobacter sp.]|nr:hypothetical protein [Candidatus Angelobacter sp.]
MTTLVAQSSLPLAQPAKEPEILFVDKVLVVAHAPDCKCVATATSTMDKHVLAVIVNQCRKEHTETASRLREAAKNRAISHIEAHFIEG